MNNTANQSLEQSTAHKYLLLGISSSIGLTMFLFSIVMGLAEDVSVVREDVAYIKGVLDGTT